MCGEQPFFHFSKKSINHLFLIKARGCNFASCESKRCGSLFQHTIQSSSGKREQRERDQKNSKKDQERNLSLKSRKILFVRF